MNKKHFNIRSLLIISLVGLIVIFFLKGEIKEVIITDNFKEPIAAFAVQNNQEIENKIVKYSNTVDNSIKNRINVDSILIIDYPLVLESLKKSLLELDKKVDFTFTINISKVKSKQKFNSQHFNIKINNNQIDIEAGTNQGLLNGIVRLENEINNTTIELRTQEISDYSNIEHRAFHIAIRGDEDKSIVKDVILKARNSYFNEIIILVISGVEFMSLDSKLVKKWSKEDLSEIVNFSKQLGFKVIPEIKFLTHQEKLFRDAYPHLMLNKTTYNPDDSKVYDIIFPVIDEILDIFKSDIFCIGHDEVAGFKADKKEKYILKKEIKLTPEQFIFDVKKLNHYFSIKNIRMMMWADMLLKPTDYPIMLQRHMHGGNGFSEMIDDLPKDIILVDWHYFEEQSKFISYDYLCEKEFFTYGGVWRSEFTNKNFTTYINNSSCSPKALVATTWYRLDKKTDKINTLLNSTGMLFWNAKKNHED